MLAMTLEPMKRAMMTWKSHEEGCYVHVLDLATIDIDSMKDQENCRTSLAGAFYMNQCLNPDLESVRRGMIIMLECEGYQWVPKSWDMKYSEQYWNDVGGIYPCRVRQYRCFNTPMVFNVLKSLGRPFVPAEIYSRMVLGCRFEQRLDAVFAVPTVEATEQRFLGRSIDALTMRYANERTFSLDAV
ncbi:expressed unknown protein [Seminavis robusta]|uniref:CRAL-TRIO domain-containing protein n=1 Tax=Seminavis robusta TaxID=568900 RepID=A0A9N8F401_9STRA|nr:expressed unknown protein [Seminavis robusta]|eukprot:Sro3332_g346900.1 n/a (186) ;mRNA; r:3499-4379